MSPTGGNSTPTARFSWINFWIYSGLVLGALASVSANIAYTYIPPHAQPEWWPRSRLWDPAAYVPPPGDVAVAVFCPVAIFILTEVITRPRWREGKLSFAVRAASAVMVGLPVAVASYLHLCSLLEYYSTIPFIAYTLPLTVDGLMLACTAALQLTGPEPVDAQLGEDSSQTMPAQPTAVTVPRPRPPLDGTAPNPLDDPADPRGPAPVDQALVLLGREGGHSVPPPVAVAASADDRLPAPAAWAYPSVGAVISAPLTDFPPAVLPVERETDVHPPVAHPAQLGGSPMDVNTSRPTAIVSPVPPVEEGAPPSTESNPTGGGGSDHQDPIGGPEPALTEGSLSQSVAFGRLGNSRLDDATIIKLAMEDRPTAPITATGLRKDFGVGSGRAGRLREEIKRRRYAQNLADGTASQTPASQVAPFAPLGREIFELISTIY